MSKHDRDVYKHVWNLIEVVEYYRLHSRCDDDGETVKINRRVEGNEDESIPVTTVD